MQISAPVTMPRDISTLIPSPGRPGFATIKAWWTNRPSFAHNNLGDRNAEGAVSRLSAATDSPK